MKWNKDEYSGFSTSTPWIGVTAPSDLPKVEEQIDDPDSLWHWYRKLIALRKDDQALELGSYEVLSVDNGLLSISRRWQAHVTHIRINFSAAKRHVHRDDSHEILASKGLISGDPERLLPFGVLITREVQDVDKTLEE